jgi:uncharacterized protein (TIGR03437 family)
VSGFTTSSDFPASAGSLSSTYAGGGDAFLAKIGAGGAASINSGGVVNGASLGAGPVAPGLVIAVVGSGLAEGAQTAPAGPLPTTLAGTAVNINGSAAPILAASPAQLLVQLPYEVSGATASLSVSVPCGTTAPMSFSIAKSAPYIRQAATGDAVAMNQDSTPNRPDSPAKMGSVITVTLTGIGPLDNPAATGTPASSATLSKATLPASATIGGWDAPIQFLGLTPGTVGWAQANLVVPGLSPGSYSVVVTIGGIASNSATVYVQ